MSTHRNIDVVCVIGTLLSLLVTLLFVNARALGVQALQVDMSYETRLFDTSAVHTIDIVMDDWEGFLEGCEDKEYEPCAVVIDGQAYKNVAIRAKGNNSLSSVASYGNDRYSFKIEFDHYDAAKNYFGLDKLCLTSLIQDNTMMKDYLVYQMMRGFGVDAPLCSYAYITVNGEEWGLYLAVEGVEDGFLRRNYGSGHGELYKPDSMSQMGQPNGGGQPGQADSADVKLQYVDDDPDSYPNIFDNAQTDVSEADQRRLISSIRKLNEGTELESVLDLEEILRYFVVHNFVCNFDSYTGQVVHNYYLYEEDGILSMIPWDYNLAFGSFQSNAGAEELINFPIDTPVSDGDMASRPMVSWIFSDAAYTEEYHRYFALFLEQYFDSGAFAQLIDGTVSLISPYVEKDPTKFCTYEEFETAAAVLRQFCLLRAQSVSGQLSGAIPSDSDGQRADSSGLIDAGGLDLSATGSMGGAVPAGGGFQGPAGAGGFRQAMGNWDGASPDGQGTPPDGQGTPPDGQGTPPDGQGMLSDGQGTPPDGQDMPLERQDGASPGDGQLNLDHREGWTRPGDNIQAGGVDGGAVPALIVSAAALLLGLAFAARFRRRLQKK